MGGVQCLSTIGCKLHFDSGWGSMSVSWSFLFLCLCSCIAVAFRTPRTGWPPLPGWPTTPTLCRCHAASASPTSPAVIPRSTPLTSTKMWVDSGSLCFLGGVCLFVTWWKDKKCKSGFVQSVSVPESPWVLKGPFQGLGHVKNSTKPWKVLGLFISQCLSDRLGIMQTSVTLVSGML